MARIVNKEIPNNRNVRAGLATIYGIGWSTAELIISKLGIENSKRIRDLSEIEIKSINSLLIGEKKEFVTEGELKEKIQKKISEQIRLGTYQGLRRSHKPNPLPIHGQRTRHNAQTAKKGGAATRKRLAVAGKKKAPTAK